MKPKSFFIFLTLTISPLALSVSACAKSETAQNGAIQNISVQDANTLIAQNPNIDIIDIRTAQEFVGSHVRSSQNIDYYATDFTQKISALPKDKPYIIYCRSGNRSGKSMEVFQSLGFSKIYNVKGGISAWEGTGLPK